MGGTEFQLDCANKRKIISKLDFADKGLFSKPLRFVTDVSQVTTCENIGADNNGAAKIKKLFRDPQPRKEHRG